MQRGLASLLTSPTTTSGPDGTLANVSVLQPDWMKDELCHLNDVDNEEKTIASSAGSAGGVSPKDALRDSHSVDIFWFSLVVHYFTILIAKQFAIKEHEETLDMDAAGSKVKELLLDQIVGLWLVPITLLVPFEGDEIGCSAVYYGIGATHILHFLIFGSIIIGMGSMAYFTMGVVELCKKIDEAKGREMNENLSGFLPHSVFMCSVLLASFVFIPWIFALLLSSQTLDLRTVWTQFLFSVNVDIFQFNWSHFSALILFQLIRGVRAAARVVSLVVACVVDNLGERAIVFPKW